MDTSPTSILYYLYFLSAGIFAVLAAIFLAMGSLKAAGRLHQLLLTNVLSSALNFFDTTPVGRIMNRFSKDIDAVDMKIPQIAEDMLICFFDVLGVIVVVSMATPLVLLALAPLTFLYFGIMVILNFMSRFFFCF